MGLTATFSEPFFTGGAITSLVPSIFDCAIDGHGYMLDTTNNQFRHASIPLIRQQADQSDTPGEHSLNPEDLWRRSVDTWHRGAGQTYLDAPDSEAGMFRTSKGVDPWVRGELSLLNETAAKITTDQTNVQIVACGDALYILDGTQLTYTTDITAGTPSLSIVGASAGGWSTPVSLATNGFYVWVLDGTNLYVTERLASTYEPWLQSGDTLGGELVAFEKGRLFVAVDNEVWNLLDKGEAKPTDPLFSHPNPDWHWTAFGESPNAIYMAGYSGDKSIIYRTAFSDALADLDVPTVAATLPDGELVRSLKGYLDFVLIGTDKGLRFAATANNGDLQIGDLVPTSPVLCFEPQDRFVWFGWTNYDTDSTGLGRVDLRTLNGTQPAYATDLMASTQGEVTSVVTFQDRRVFTVAGDGVWAETTSKVASGTVESGYITYSLSTAKTALFLETQHRKGAGSFQPAISADENPFVNVGGTIVTSANESGTDQTTVGQLAGELFEVRYTLNRTGTDGPVLGRFTLRVDPQAPRREKLTLPLVLRPNLYPRSGTTERLSPRTEREHIAELSRTRRPVTVQTGFDSRTAIVDDFEFIADEYEGYPTFDHYGVLVVSAKTVN